MTRMEASADMTPIYHFPGPDTRRLPRLQFFTTRLHIHHGFAEAPPANLLFCLDPEEEDGMAENGKRKGGRGKWLAAALVVLAALAAGRMLTAPDKPAGGKGGPGGRGGGAERQMEVAVV